MNVEFQYHASRCVNVWRPLFGIRYESKWCRRSLATFANVCLHLEKINWTIISMHEMVIHSVRHGRHMASNYRRESSTGVFGGGIFARHRIRYSVNWHANKIKFRFSIVLHRNDVMRYIYIYILTIDGVWQHITSWMRHRSETMQNNTQNEVYVSRQVADELISLFWAGVQNDVMQWGNHNYYCFVYVYRTFQLLFLFFSTRVRFAQTA